MSGSAPAADRDARSSPLELLWDLVFVFALTQATTLLAAHLTWSGAARALLVLALVWWAWSAFVWAVNAQLEERGLSRIVLLSAAVLIFVTGLAIPRAFAGEATLFASTYAIVRLLHLVLYAQASRRGAASAAAIAGFALTVLAGMALLLAGAIAGGAWQDALWALAVLIDYAGPLLTRQRLRELQEVAVAHFAERYGLFVLICLGESLAEIGLGATRGQLDAADVAAASLAVLITVGMWWVYFAHAAEAAERRLRSHADPVLAASDAYSYLHLLLVAGIILFAVGARLALPDVGAPLGDGARLALCAGVALYLLGHTAFRLRLAGPPSAGEPLAAAAMLVLYAAGGGLAAWALAALTALVLALVCAAEELRSRAAVARAP